MSVQANLVLDDGQTTPVAKTFSPRGADLKLATWRDTTAGISIGMPVITLSNKESPGNNGAYRVEARVQIPVLETISGDAGGYIPAPRVAYTMFGKVELVAPQRSTVQNRKDLRAFVANLLAHAVMTETLVNFDPPN
jgi:hypothetical protein